MSRFILAFALPGNCALSQSIALGVDSPLGPTIDRPVTPTHLTRTYALGHSH